MHALLDRIRTQAIRVLHQIRDLTAEGDELPAEAASQAVNVMIHGGERHQINVTTNQAQHGDAGTAAPPGDERALRLARKQVLWAIVGVAVGVISAVLAYLQLRG